MALRCASIQGQEQLRQYRGQMRGIECGCSMSPLFLKTFVCIPTSAYFFSQSPMTTEIFHNHLYLHHFRQCQSVVQVLSEEKRFFFLLLIASNMKKSPFCNRLQPTNPMPLQDHLWMKPSGETKNQLFAKCHENVTTLYMQNTLKGRKIQLHSRYCSCLIQL